MVIFFGDTTDEAAYSPTNPDESKIDDNDNTQQLQPREQKGKAQTGDTDDQIA